MVTYSYGSFFFFSFWFQKMYHLRGRQSMKSARYVRATRKSAAIYPEIWRKAPHPRIVTTQCIEQIMLGQLLTGFCKSYPKSAPPKQKQIKQYSCIALALVFPYAWAQTPKNDKSFFLTSTLQAGTNVIIPHVVRVYMSATGWKYISVPLMALEWIATVFLSFLRPFIKEQFWATFLTLNLQSHSYILRWLDPKPCNVFGED